MPLMTNYLLLALKELLGAPASGTVAYARCFSRDEIDSILQLSEGGASGWRVRGVGSHPGNHWITGDKAVEIREDKGPAVCLLILPDEAGAGMDGIYNAARELSEAKIFNFAVRHARGSLSRSLSDFSREAVKRAQGTGGKRKKVSGRQELAFYVEVLKQPNRPGGALSALKLWPVDGGPEEASANLPYSAVMAERLLSPVSAMQPPGIRVASLSLGEGELAVGQASLLEGVLRNSAGKPVEDVIREIANSGDLWLGNLKPAFFNGKIGRMELVSWRHATTGRVHRWSGLIQAANNDANDGLPQFHINETCKLTVKWKVFPEVLPAGAVTYEIQLVSGNRIIASETVMHRGNAECKVVFDKDHFEEIEAGDRLEVLLRVSTPGVGGIAPLETEDFLLCHGEGAANSRTSSGEVFRCVADGLTELRHRADFECFVSERQQGKQGQPDKAGTVRLGEVPGGQMLAFRPNGSKRGFRVERPGLLREIEEDWWRRETEFVGRWRIRCRPDGNRVGKLDYIPVLSPDAVEAQKLLEATRRFREDCLRGGGVMSRFYLHNHSSAASTLAYLNAWAAALETEEPGLALANTLEITSMSGKTLGLVVLPQHSLRVAWQCGYDTLALNLCLEEPQRLNPARIRKILSVVDGANVPFLLPGLTGGGSFLFAETLGFAGVVMVLQDDPEPKASTALMAVCFAGDSPGLEPSSRELAGDAIAREFSHYINAHPHCGLLQVQAHKPGDAAAVVKAVGKALVSPESEDSPYPESGERYRPVAVRLDIYPSAGQLGVAGRYLTRLTERRRKRSAAPPEEDAWCLESMSLPGNRSVPRLRWARRPPGSLLSPAHLSLAFDSHTNFIKAGEAATQAPILAYGLVPHLIREFCFEKGQPRWRLFIPSEYDGMKLPERSITERIINLQKLILQKTAANAGFKGAWPELHTAPLDSDVELLSKLHDLSDWVVTMDRNAGVEYFDSPRNLEKVFDEYLINSAPGDFGCHQVITSTRKFEEIKGLLHRTLMELGLNGSARNCDILLRHLKGLSGRLAMHLAAGARAADSVKTSAELVALALVRAKCHAAPDDLSWHPLSQGFFVPLDDVRDLVGANEKETRGSDLAENRCRAALLYVGIPVKKGKLSLTFIEVKYRRYLSQARTSQICEQIEAQALANKERWKSAFFSPRSSAIEKTLQGVRLGQLLRFYAEKAQRHHLSDAAYSAFQGELFSLLRNPADYEFSSVSQAGYIFCPDFPATQPEPQPWDGPCQIRLFGPDSLPDQSSPGHRKPLASELAAAGDSSTNDHLNEGFQTAGEEWQGVCLGESGIGDKTYWLPSINTNPHLMIVGLPGMGKTHSLINICNQLQRQGIAPIIFSYHDDIDTKLPGSTPPVVMHDCLPLGFNPMAITLPNTVAHVESAGQLRDIFQAVFPDLGELQRERLREAIKHAYEESGWVNGNIGATPEFRRFFEILQSAGVKDKSVQHLLLRLSELDDFKFFSPLSDVKSLLDELAPQVIRIHSIANEAMQRASAGFILYRIYQDMFKRGRASRITHAIVFDEAHRAGKLKLLPVFAKECRKYGLSIIVASQEAKDFDSGLFAAIGSYLALRVTDTDAKIMARNAAGFDEVRSLADRLKSMPKYEALFFSESLKKPLKIKLSNGEL